MLAFLYFRDYRKGELSGTAVRLLLSPHLLPSNRAVGEDKIMDTFKDELEVEPNKAQGACECNTNDFRVDAK
jgi:hypothetical protein